MNAKQKIAVVLAVALLAVGGLAYLVMAMAEQSVKDEVELISRDFIKHAFSDTATDITLDQEFATADVIALYNLKRTARKHTPYAQGARLDFEVTDFTAEHLANDAYEVTAKTAESFQAASGEVLKNQVTYRLLVDTEGYRYMVKKAIANGPTDVLLFPAFQDEKAFWAYDFSHYEEDVAHLTASL